MHVHAADVRASNRDLETLSLGHRPTPVLWASIAYASNGFHTGPTAIPPPVSSTIPNSSRQRTFLVEANGHAYRNHKKSFHSSRRFRLSRCAWLGPRSAENVWLSEQGPRRCPLRGCKHLQGPCLNKLRGSCTEQTCGGLLALQCQVWARSAPGKLKHPKNTAGMTRRKMRHTRHQPISSLQLSGCWELATKP